MFLPVDLVIGGKLGMMTNGEMRDKMLVQLFLLDLEESVCFRVEAEDGASIGVDT